MTAQDIIAKLFSTKGVTKLRIEKAQGASMRARLNWALVLAQMTDDQRKAIDDAS